MSSKIRNLRTSRANELPPDGVASGQIVVDGYAGKVVIKDEGSSDPHATHDIGGVGQQGVPGPAGQRGVPGDPGLQGPQGAQGLKGDKGDTGDAGAQGPAGVKGDPGNAGAQGPAGAKGDTGDAGAQGPQGNTGPAGQPPSGMVEDVRLTVHQSCDSEGMCSDPSYGLQKKVNGSWVTCVGLGV